MKGLLIILLFITSSVCFSQTPTCFTEKEFKGKASNSDQFMACQLAHNDAVQTARINGWSTCSPNYSQDPSQKGPNEYKCKVRIVCTRNLCGI